MAHSLFSEKNVTARHQTGMSQKVDAVVSWISSSLSIYEPSLGLFFLTVLF